jgi:hypothetical protein
LGRYYIWFIVIVAGLAATTARGTGGWSLIGGRPGALAVLTGLVATYFHLGLFAKRRFLKRKIQISARITATLLPSPATTAATNIHAKEVTEYIPKDIAKILEVIRIKSAEAIAVAAHAGMAKLVIALALLRIHQYGIGFRTLFKLFFRGVIAGVAVRMVLHGQLAV